MYGAQQNRSGILSRSGPALGVIGIHLVLGYGIMSSVGLVEMPKISAPVQAIFIEEDTATSEPEPALEIEPEIETAMPLEQPAPDLQIEQVLAPPAEVPVPASDTAIAAAPMSAPAAQELKARGRVEPVYPPASRRAGEQGTVRLQVLVDERGRPVEVKVEKGSGFARLDEAAMQAVRKWRFEAATDGTRKVSAWTRVAITFRLTDANG